MNELLSLLKNAEQQDSMKKAERYVLVTVLVILIGLVALMMFDIRRLQGTARVVNYAGIMRGGTQRFVKLEMTGFTNQVLEERINKIVLGLRDGSKELNLIQLDDEEYQKHLNDTITIWNAIREKIADFRIDRMDNREELLFLSEDHFVTADKTVALAEEYSQRLASRIEKLEYGIYACFIVIAVMFLRQLMHIIFAIGSHKDFRERDTVCGLYKRDYFYEHADNVLKEKNNSPYAVLCIYVEHLKVMNERYGVQKCNTMLQELVEMLHKYIPDCIVHGRLAEDTFAFLIKKQPDDGWLNRMQEGIEQDFWYPVSVKYGIYDEIARNLSMSTTCDRVMMSVESIKNQYGFNLVHYDETVIEQARKQHFILENMEAALTGHQFKPYFQPKHSLHTDRTGGAEVLVRWIHPQQGFMNPGEFIPLFEENGFVARMDFYIWEEACKALKSWKDKGWPVVPLSVNMSRKDFDVPDVVAKLVSLVDTYGLEHNLLHIEVTESTISGDPAKLASIVRELHEAGFVIELDDFGSGYSSIATLHELTLDVLKLDMSLVRKDNPTVENSALKFAVMMGKMLNLKLVAEGVETAEQVERLRGMGCDYIQGFYYSRPLPQTDFEAYLQKE